MKKILLAMMIIFVSTAAYKIFYTPQTTKQYQPTPNELSISNSYSKHNPPSKDLYTTEPQQHEPSDIQAPIISKYIKKSADEKKTKTFFLLEVILAMKMIVVELTLLFMLNTTLQTKV